MQRARKAEDKEERRRMILASARARWSERASYAAFNMAEVAERANLAKGTLYIYFATKEALLLALLQEELGAWMDVMDARLDQGGVWTPRRVAQLLGETLSERPALVELLSVMSSLLERNVPEEEVLQFKVFLRDRVGATGERLERRLGPLRPGEGAKALVVCHALVTGLLPMANPPPAVTMALERPDMAMFRVDFGKELSAAMWAWLVGTMELSESRR